jgi:hypothetical protein
MEDLHEDTNDNYHGDKVRHVGNGLEDLFVTPVVDGVKAQGKNDGKREAGDNIVKGNSQSVSNHSGEHVRIKKFFKICQTHPGAAPDTSKDGILLEGNLYPQHGYIRKDDDIKGRKKEEKVQLPIPAVFFLQTLTHFCILRSYENYLLPISS